MPDAGAFSTLQSDITIIKADTTELLLQSLRQLGLAQENFFLDGQAGGAPSFDLNGNLTSARMRIYSVAASVGTDSDVLATYFINATFTPSGIVSYKAVKQ